MGRDQEVLKILKNPSSRRLSAILARAEYSDVRAVLTDVGELHVWDGNEATHADVLDDYGLDGLRLDLRADSITIVLAGGALELLDCKEKVDVFFERHGHSGATLADTDVLADIADAETLKVRKMDSLRRAMPTLPTVNVDIDPRIDWGAVTLTKVLAFYGEIGVDLKC